MQNMTDTHYFQLPSQGNVYSLTKLAMCDGLNKVLVASLKRKVYSFEFVKEAEGFLKPAVKEIPFTYIPSGAEIISIDAFNKSQDSDDFVIGITIIKSNGEQGEETYLNIYSEWETSSEFNLDNIAQSCLTLELNFTPYQLYHTELVTNVDDSDIKKEVVWLLSGGDKKIHMFREDNANHCYNEVDIVDFFPEFSDPPSTVLCMDMHHCSNGLRRVSAYGCECGLVKLEVFDNRNNKAVLQSRAQFEAPISSVRLFTLESNLKCPSFVDRSDSLPAENTEPVLHLLVTYTLKLSIIYMNVEEHGFSKSLLLPGSNQSDSVLCSGLADLTTDGQNEVILGTYGQQLLAYQFLPGNNDDPECRRLPYWKLFSQHSFANPIHSVLHLDLTGDGGRELVVLTSRGVHVLQHKPAYIRKRFLQKLKMLKFHDDCGVDLNITLEDVT